MNKESIPKREVLAWCLFDFANSSFTTLIVTVAYSIYFTQVVAKGYQAEQLWGWGYSGSMLIIAILSPWLGAVADCSAKKKQFLIAFTALCVIGTSALIIVEEGDIIQGLVLFALANIGFNGGLAFYNAFLLEISDSSNIGRISGYGWALGYIGGLLCLGLAYPLLKGGFEPDNLLNFRLSFLLTAIFFLFFSIPTFLILKERTLPRGLKHGETYWSHGFRRLGDTFHEMRRFRELIKYLAGYLLYTDGINTVIVFSSIFANKVLNFSPKEIIIYFFVTQITAALGAYVFGFITDRIGAKRTISITLVIWIIVAFCAYLVQTKAQFYILGLAAGVALGSNQSASRVLLGLLTPSGKSAEFFGLFSLTGKFAATLGPLVYGYVTAITGTQRIAVLTIGIFFLAGLILLQTVREEKGIESARGYKNTMDLT